MEIQNNQKTKGKIAVLMSSFINNHHKDKWIKITNQKTQNCWMD